MTTDEELLALKTHYDVLGVQTDASHKQIQAAYYTAARKWHPDRYIDRPARDAEKAELAMRQVNRAWEVLGSVSDRKAYDAELVGKQPSSAKKSDSVHSRVTRVDPTLVDRDRLQAKRVAQQEEVSANHSSILRAVPFVVVIGALLAVFVFSAYANNQGTSPETTFDGPSLGAGIEVGSCVDVLSGPSLIARKCTATADGRVLGSRYVNAGECPVQTTQEVTMRNGHVACLGSLTS